jgi:N-acetylmuramoyl-L-alanine amidase
VEALENSVVEKYEGGIQAVKRYDDLSFILADMSQNEHLQESYQLADILEQEITKETNFYMRGVKQANFYVMRGAFMPAVLIETGFLSNPEEEKLLNSEEYQNKIAKAIAESLIYFKKQFDKM